MRARNIRASHVGSLYLTKSGRSVEGLSLLPLLSILISASDCLGLGLWIAASESTVTRSY